MNEKIEQSARITNAMVERALFARVPGGAEVWVWLPQKDAFTPHQTAYDVMRCALEAAYSQALGELERERDQWRETSNGHRDDAEQFRQERIASEALVTRLKQGIEDALDGVRSVRIGSPAEERLLLAHGSYDALEALIEARSVLDHISLGRNR